MSTQRYGVRVALFIALLACLLPTGASPQDTSISASGLGTNLPPPRLENGQTVHDITGGTRHGANLFHSFGVFSVGDSNVANFLNDTSSRTNNILSRVTGGNPSNILGEVRTTGFGEANLFLMNSSGILFGLEAQINVEGSFHATTADFLRLQDGVTFNTQPGPEDVLLTCAPVTAFGFLEGDQASIQVDRSTLDVSTGNTMSLVGGDIEIIGGKLTAPAGQINIASVNSKGEVAIDPSTSVVSFDTNEFEDLGRISLLAGPDILNPFFGVAPDPTDVDVGSDTAPSGSVFISGGDTLIDRSRVFAPRGIGGGGNITFNVARLFLRNGAEINSDAGGDVRIKAKASVALSGRGSVDPTMPTPTRVSSSTTGTADAGRIIINTPTLEVDDGALVQATSTGEGRAGDIELNVERLTVTGGGEITNRTDRSGNGGMVRVRGIDSAGAADFVSLNNKGQISALTRGEGAGGIIDINATNLMLDDGQINTSTIGSNDAGTIIVASNDISLTNGARIESTTDSAGNAGNISINASPGERLSVSISDRAMVTASTRGVGNGGSVEIRANGGDVTVAGSGSAVTTASLVTDQNAGIAGPAGRIMIEAGRFVVRDGGQVSASTSTSGAGGNVAIESSDIRLSGGGTISASTRGSGRGGNIEINEINGKSGTLSLSGPPSSSISSETAGGDGDAGTVAIRAGRLTVSDGAAISASTSGNGKGGNVNIEATNIDLLNGGEIAARSDSTSLDSGESGSLSIRADDTIRIFNGSSINVETQQARAGDIALNAGFLLHLRENGRVSTSARDGAGDGGNISIDPVFTILDEGSRITARAFRGRGGNIDITTNFLFQSPDSVIDASSEFGVSGNVEIDSPDTDVISGALALPESFLDVTSLLSDRCSARTAKGASSFIVSGRGGVPPGPETVLPSYNLNLSEPPQVNQGATTISADWLCNR